MFIVSTNTQVIFTAGVFCGVESFLICWLELLMMDAAES